MDFHFTFPIMRDGYQLAEIDGIAVIEIGDTDDWYVESVEIFERKRVGKRLDERRRSIPRPGITSSGMWDQIERDIWRHVENDCSTEIEENLFQDQSVRDFGDEHGTYRAGAL